MRTVPLVHGELNNMEGIYMPTYMYAWADNTYLVKITVESPNTDQTVPKGYLHFTPEDCSLTDRTVW